MSRLEDNGRKRWMKAAKKGIAHVTARARVMLLLGEQLITDEVAAISELVKNAYDADATKVVVTLFHVSDPKTGYIAIKDNGHGMTSDVVLSSWLELGTLSKARGTDLKPRFSEMKKRPFLGEKGLGRLAVHKLGHRTELITRRIHADVETRLTIDWTAFEKSEGFLEEVPVNWEETSPNVFIESDFLNGTQITIRELQRAWNKDTIERTERSLRALKSPFMDLSDFDISIKIEDDLAPFVRVHEMSEIIDKATYKFVGEVDEAGQLEYRYEFQRDDYPALSRKVNIRRDIRDSEFFSNNRKPTCGPFRLRFYSWDLDVRDQRAVLGDTQTYREMIEPNTGIKVFRDGFRVLPYGNPDNDWLGMDLRRVRQFEERLSRNQAIGAVEISANTNPRLLDKTDREGLIDNEALRDFQSLVQSALTQFEAQRYPDRHNLKEVTGRLKGRETDRTKFAQTAAFLSKAIMDQPKLDSAVKLQFTRLISDARQSFDSMLAEQEQPLLVAASIGLTYMMPTHEVRRDIHEALKILRGVRDSKEVPYDKIDSAIVSLRQADSTVGGIGRLMQRTREEEVFELERPAKLAVQLMRYRMERNLISHNLEVRSAASISGSDRLVTMLLLNFLDNSIYWLLRNRPEQRKIKIIVDSKDSECILVVSDSGPGFGEDDIETVTLPFFTRKPNGMGLGLYIADRIARMNRGRLKILSADDLPGLLSGANIAAFFPRAKK